MAINQQTQPKLDTREPVINDFAFSVATKNGSGSQTSNNVLVKSLFQMGIPVNGKNLFPSNIKGLPTWYTIRASKDGYTARKALTEIVVAYNDSTATEDVANLPPGGVCITTDKIARVIKQRDDISYYEIPVAKLMRQTEVPSAFRKLVENMTYVGAVAQLFDIPLDLIYDVLLANFKGKAKPALMNHDVVKLAYDWTADNLVKTDPYSFERMDGTQGKIMMTGNDAGALGAVFGGVNVVSWYPITPSTSFVDGVIGFRHLRQTEDKENTVAIVQAEDELAAAGIVVGAGLGGRALPDIDQRSRHQLDGGVRRPGIFCRDSGGLLEYHAHGTEHRAAHAHQPGRPALHSFPRSWRQPPALPYARQLEGSFRIRLEVLRHFGSAAIAGLCHQRPRPGHEQLAVGSV